MGTPEEKFDTAMDPSSEREAREQAIDELQTANDCDKLAEIVQREGIERELQKRALSNLAHPQCKPMLEKLVDNEHLPEPLHEQAESLLEETVDHTGAGPDS